MQLTLLIVLITRSGILPLIVIILAQLNCTRLPVITPVTAPCEGPLSRIMS